MIGSTVLENVDLAGANGDAPILYEVVDVNCAILAASASFYGVIGEFLGYQRRRILLL